MIVYTNFDCLFAVCVDSNKTMCLKSAAITRMQFLFPFEFFDRVPNVILTAHTIIPRFFFIVPTRHAVPFCIGRLKLLLICFDVATEDTSRAEARPR